MTRRLVRRALEMRIAETAIAALGKTRPRARLRQVRDRAMRRQLEPDDWAILRAVIEEEMRRRVT